VDEERRGIDTSSIDGIIGYRLRRAQVAGFARFAERFAAVGIKPAEYSVLVLLADNPRAKPSEIAAALGIKRANFVSLAAGLETRGLIERQRPEADRRAQALVLTRSGGAMVRRMRKIQDAFETELVAALGGAAERDRLIKLLARLG
jgi:DNA-binding MarR family transcriptional regulator